MKPILSREMALIADCCRWPPSPARHAAVRAAAEAVDWDRVEALMARHRVQPLVFAALSTAGVRLPPARVKPLMRGIALIERLNTVMAAESARLQALLDAHGIASLIVKGAPLAMLAYNTLAVKASKDIDLLVAPQDVPAVFALLRADGYRLLSPAKALTAAQLGEVIRYDREMEFVHPVHGKLQLELQWGLSRNPHILPELVADGPYQSVDLGGGHVVRTLPTDDLFAYLCIHGAAHGWFRLKWLADVAALAGQGDVERSYRAAQARGLGYATAQALLLACELLALDLPPALSAELHASKKVRRMVQAARDLLTGPGAEAEIEGRRFGGLKLRRAEWLTIRDARDLRNAAARYLTVTGDVLAVPLPRRLHFLYPLLRLPLGIGRLARRRRSRIGGDDT